MFAQEGPFVKKVTKNGTDEPIHKAKMETQMQRTNLWASRERGGGMDWELGIDKYTLLVVV